MKRLTLALLLIATTVGAAEIRVPMPDGVELKADLYLPDAKGPFPTILIRTPYGKEGLRLFGEKFVRRNYAVVIQDVRGKYASGGTFLPFVNETADGLATLDWVAASEWSDGRIGMWGSSYLAMCGLLLARERHPALRAVWSASGWLDGEGINASGGATHIGLAIPWLLFEGGKSQQSLKHFDLDELFHHKPLRDVFKVAGVDMPAWMDERMVRTNKRTMTTPVRVPIFHMTGWYDFVAPASIATWRSMRSASTSTQTIMIGPWIHDQFWGEDTLVGELDAGPESILGVDRVAEMAAEWFDVHVRGLASKPKSAVTVFVLGENRWRSFEEWPPRNTTTRAFSLEGSRSFLFDPENPVPTLGGANFHFFPNNGIRDQSDIALRDDVLVYDFQPLERDLVLAGPVRAVLHVSTDGPDTDFTAKLIHVRPDGKAFNIVDGIARLSFRDGQTKSEVDPGRIYRLSIDLGEIAIRIPKGHRLALHVSSSNFPKFDRNPNTGQDPFEATEFRAARQTVHSSRRHPSRVEITILKGEER